MQVPGGQMYHSGYGINEHELKVMDEPPSLLRLPWRLCREDVGLVQQQQQQQGKSGAGASQEGALAAGSGQRTCLFFT